MEKKMTKTIPTGLIARWTGLIVLLLAVGTTGCEREWTGRIEGIVTDTETETGVSGVLVTARSEKNGYSVNTVTDTEGYYYLDSVRWGPNQVNLYHPRYETASKYADVIRDKTVEIDFEVDRLDEYVDPVLTVRVVNGNGDPVNQAILDLYQLKQSTYEYFFYLGTQTTDTDGQAEFTLPRLYEEEVIEFQLRVAAYGYFDHVRDFAVSWTVPDPVLTIVMDAL